MTRSLADGFRLFATGIVLAALVAATPGVEEATRSWFPSLDPTVALLIVAVSTLGTVTIAYTFFGGMFAVIWTDVIQLSTYLLGAALAAIILLRMIPGGWDEVVRVGSAAGKFRVFDFTWDVTRDYTFWSGLLGGALLTTATHGTDQLLVQRYLCSRSARDAKMALLSSGVVVFVQFVLFLLIGVMLYVYYVEHASDAVAGFTSSGLVQTDRVFPTFIVEHLPPGILGLVVAAVFAAAMSTLSSSLNSSAAATMGDFYIPLTNHARSDSHYLMVSRWVTFCWGAVQIAVAVAAVRLSSQVVDEVLGISSFTGGVILGTFMLGVLSRSVSQSAAAVGILAGTFTMLAVAALTDVSWQWYVLIGTSITFATGLLTSTATRRWSSEKRA